MPAATSPYSMAVAPHSSQREFADMCSLDEKVILHELRLPLHLSRGALISSEYCARPFVVGVVRADLRGDAEVGAEEGGPEFRDQLLAAIRGIPEALCAGIAV
jgi:hypothetical protein